MSFEVVKIGPHTLYSGDCLEILPTLGKVDCVVTDPPYGINHKSHGQIFKNAISIRGDESTELSEYIRRWCVRYSIPCCMFFSPYAPMDGWRNVLCWNKGGHVGIGGDKKTCWKRDFELIGVEGNRQLNGGRESAVISINALLPPPTGHFCEKPVELMGYLIWKLSVSRESIFDPFMGSGTTGVACVRLGRVFTGIEIEPKYFDIACHRIETEMNSTPLFEPETKPTTKEMFASV